jgi:hypothetical protein
VSQIATDPVLARVHREQVVEPRLTQIAPVIQRGIARADLRADTDARLVHDRRSTHRHGAHRSRGVTKIDPQVLTIAPE